MLAEEEAVQRVAVDRSVASVATAACMHACMHQSVQHASVHPFTPQLGCIPKRLSLWQLRSADDRSITSARNPLMLAPLPISARPPRRTCLR